MVKILFSLLLFATCLRVSAQTAITEAPAKPDFGDGRVQPALAAIAEAVAKKWITAVAKNNAQNAKVLTGFPFAWDRREIISDEQSFLKKFQQRKSAREAAQAEESLKALMVKTITSRRTIIDNIIPMDVYVVEFTTRIGTTTHGGRMAIRMVQQPLVIGFSD